MFLITKFIYYSIFLCFQFLINKFYFIIILLFILIFNF